MQINNSIKILTLSMVASALFVGCGGGSDSGSNSPTEPTTLTGTFVDAPVQGLGYKTLTQSGFTDASGQFKYVAGEEVEFRLGNLLLGKGAAGALLTPYSVSDNNDSATNIALLLQNFDNDRTDTVLNISALKDYNLGDFNISDTNANLESKLTTLLATGEFQTLRGGAEFDLLDSATVKGAMDSFIAANSTKYDKKFTEAFLSGKTFYQEYEGSPGLDIYSFGTNSSTFTDENPGSDTYEQTLSAFSAADNMLLVKNGNLYEYTTDTNGVFNDGMNIFTIKTVDETKIVTTMGTMIVNWYLTKEAAQFAFNNSLELTGFTQAFLDNTVFYKTSDEYPQYKNQYRNGSIYFAGDEENSQGWNTDFTTASSTYVIEDGLLKASFSNGDEVTVKIISITNTSIEVEEIHAVYGSRTSTWYTDKEAAQQNLISQAMNKTGSVYLLQNGEYVQSPYNGGFTTSNFTVSENGGDLTTLPYSEIEGILKVDWSSFNDPDEYHKIIAVDSQYVYGCIADSLTAAKACSAPTYRINY